LKKQNWYGKILKNEYYFACFKKPSHLASLTSSCFRLRSEDLPPPSFSVVAELEEDSETRKGRSKSWSAPKYESQIKYNL